MPSSPLGSYPTPPVPGRRTSCMTTRWSPGLGGVLLALGMLALAGCSDEPSLTDPIPTQPEEIEERKVPATESLQDRVERPHEAPFREISRTVKEFGGYFYDREGNMVAYLTDPGREAAARELLEPILQIRERELGERERSTGRILFRKADFSFSELAAWRDRATHAVLDVPGVEWTDLDEVENRFVVGISKPSVEAEVLRVLREREVPREAVLFEEAGRIVDLVTLRQHSRPLEGGFQIQRAGGGNCTLGFNAYWNGYGTFLTNSHCTATQLSTSYSLFYQSNNSISSHLAGMEIHDPAGWSCGFFWHTRCRWSDAAVVYKYNSVPWNLGWVARTNSWGFGQGDSGSIHVNPNNPRMRITGEYSYPTVGVMMDKMGRTTGWTYGYVAKTCVDHNKQGGWRAICQDWVEHMHAAGGDSGSPMFRWHGNTVTLAGILWGGHTQGGKHHTLFSAMWNIRSDVGSLSTF